MLAFPFPRLVGFLPGVEGFLPALAPLSLLPFFFFLALESPLESPLESSDTSPRVRIRVPSGNSVEVVVVYMSRYHATTHTMTTCLETIGDRSGRIGGYIGGFRGLQSRCSQETDDAIRRKGRHHPVDKSHVHVDEAFTIGFADFTRFR